MKEGCISLQSKQQRCTLHNQFNGRGAWKTKIYIIRAFYNSLFRRNAKKYNKKYSKGCSKHSDSKRKFGHSSINW